jgi:hypothetical protein
MIDDLNKYSKDLKKFTQEIFLGKDDYDRRRILDISDNIKVPCMIITIWCGEVSGYPDYLKKSFDSLTKFYCYTEIKNLPENCPWRIE